VSREIVVGADWDEMVERRLCRSRKGSEIECFSGEAGSKDDPCAALTGRKFINPTSFLLQVSRSDLHVKVYEGDKEAFQVGVQKGKGVCGYRGT